MTTSGHLIISVLKQFKHKIVKLDVIEKHYAGEQVEIEEQDTDTRQLYNQLEQLQREKGIRQDEILKYLRKMIRYQQKHLFQTNSDLQKLYSNEINRDSFSGQMITARNIIINMSNSDDAAPEPYTDDTSKKLTNLLFTNDEKAETSLVQSPQENPQSPLFPMNKQMQEAAQSDDENIQINKEINEINNEINQINTINEINENNEENVISVQHDETAKQKSLSNQETVQILDTEAPEGDQQKNEQDTQQAEKYINYQTILTNITTDNKQKEGNDETQSEEQYTAQQRTLTCNEKNTTIISMIPEIRQNSNVVITLKEQTDCSTQQRLSLTKDSNCDDISDLQNTMAPENTNEQKQQKNYETYSELDDLNLNNNDIKSRGHNNSSYSLNAYKKFKKFSSMTEMVIKNKQDGDLNEPQIQSSISKLTKSQTTEQIIPSTDKQQNILSDNITQQLGEDVQKVQSQPTSDLINQQSPRFLDVEQAETNEAANKPPECEENEKVQAYNVVAQNVNIQEEETQKDKIEVENLPNNIITNSSDKTSNTNNEIKIASPNTSTVGITDAQTQTDFLTASLIKYLTPEDVGLVDAAALNKLEPTNQRQYFETIIQELRLSGRLQAGINIQLRKQVQEFEVKILSLETRLQQEKTASIQRLKNIESNYQVLKAQNDTLTAGVSYRDNRIESLRCENATLREKHAELQSYISSTENTHNNDIKRLQAILDAQKQTSTAELQDAEKRLHNYTISLNQENQNLLNINQENKKVILQQNVKIDELKLENQEQKIKIQQQKDQLVLMQKNFILYKRDTQKAHAAEIQALNETLAEVERNAGVTKYTDTEQRLINQVNELKEQIGDRDRALKDQELQAERQRSAYEGMRADRDASQTEIRRLTRELNDLKACVEDTMGASSGQAFSAANAVTTLQGICSSLRREKARLETDVEEFQRRVSAAEQRVEGLESQLAEKDAALKQTVEFFQEKLNSDHFMVKYHNLKLHLKDVENELTNNQEKQKGLMTQMLKLQTEKDRALFASNMRAQEQNKKRILLQASTKAGR